MIPNQLKLCSYANPEVRSWLCCKNCLSFYLLLLSFSERSNTSASDFEALFFTFHTLAIVGCSEKMVALDSARTAPYQLLLLSSNFHFSYR